MSGIEALGILKEYGLAGVIAWLFWWTLRRMMASHDATVGQLKAQLQTQCETARAAGETFTTLVENHMTHVNDTLTSVNTSLTLFTEHQRDWQGRMLDTLEQIRDGMKSRRRAA
jgi:hypothetical protein